MTRSGARRDAGATPRRLDVEAAADWEPLERVARLCRQCRELPAPRIEEFMYMGRLVAAGRPPVQVYKHVDTRRYLCLDDCGHAFTVTRSLPAHDSAPRLDCRPIRDLAGAVRRVVDPDADPAARHVDMAVAERPATRTLGSQRRAQLPAGDSISGERLRSAHDPPEATL